MDAVLKRYNQVLDVGRDDLENILHMAEMNAMGRRLSDLRCRDIMTPDVKTVEYGTDLQDAWALMRRHRHKALPVVDRQRRIIGIVTLADFMRHADVDQNHGMRDRLQQLIRRSGTTTHHQAGSGRADHVRQGARRQRRPLGRRPDADLLRRRSSPHPGDRRREPARRASSRSRISCGRFIGRVGWS